MTAQASIRCSVSPEPGDVELYTRCAREPLGAGLALQRVGPSGYPRDFAISRLQNCRFLKVHSIPLIVS
jgi:hypothetical protein